MPHTQAECLNVLAECPVCRFPGPGPRNKQLLCPHPWHDLADEKLKKNITTYYEAIQRLQSVRQDELRKQDRMMSVLFVGWMFIFSVLLFTLVMQIL